MAEGFRGARERVREGGPVRVWAAAAGLAVEFPGWSEDVAEALAARLGEVLRDEAGRKEVARRARAEWERRFQVERYGEEVAGLLAGGR